MRSFSQILTFTLIAFLYFDWLYVLPLDKMIYMAIVTPIAMYTYTHAPAPTGLYALSGIIYMSSLVVYGIYPTILLYLYSLSIFMMQRNLYYPFYNLLHPHFPKLALVCEWLCTHILQNTVNNISYVIAFILNLQQMHYFTRFILNVTLLLLVWLPYQVRYYYMDHVMMQAHLAAPRPPPVQADEPQSPADQADSGHLHCPPHLH